MKNTDSHIYLYAKGHYKEGDLIEDLQKVFGERNAIDPECVSAEGIMQMLLTMTQPHVNDSYHFRDFVVDLHPSNHWKFSSKSTYIFEHAVIRKCLSVLAMTRVLDGDKVLIELDDPDPGILPLSKSAQAKSKELSK